MHSSQHKTTFRFTSRAQQLREKKEPPPKQPVRLSRLMALAIRFEDLIKSGEVADYSELSVRYGVDRGRISRIMHLRLLAPDLQEKLLNLGESEAHLNLKAVLPICKTAYWKAQRESMQQHFSR